MKILDGTISGEVAICEVNPQNNAPADLDKVSVTIVDGVFATTLDDVDAPVILSVDDKIEVQGGSFNREVPEKLRATGYSPVQYPDGSFGVCNHNLTFASRVELTCGTPGSIAHYYCANCELFFEDEDATLQLSPDNISLPATGKHAFGEWSVIVEPTADKEGSFDRL